MVVPRRLLVLIALLLAAFTTIVHADDDAQSANIATVTSESMTDGSDTLRTNNEQSLTTPTQPTTAVSGDAIQQFVAGDFSQRQAMLSAWPGSVESLDNLVELIANDELYQGNRGQTYLLNAEDQLFTYPDKTETSDWPSDLSQVTLTNTLRSALIFGQAKVKLESDKPAQRLQAVEILADNIDQVDPAIITAAAANEDNANVQKALTALQARIDFKNGDLPTQIEAVNLLADSDNPQVLVDLESALASDNLDPALEAALSDARDSVARRIEISTWTGHIFTGMSTASILLLAALGLAITFGLLGVINMAHGELIMIGAYTTYVVQNLFQAYLPDMAG
ncbi:MAG TPA: urea ABC transporter permease subunit UrtB, partial [Psychrobacter sp.]|nr:urea ABC transporter permease subunit UrtB [Psychrobacter sp.]